MWSGGSSARATTEAHQPNVQTEMHRIYDNRGEIREAEDGRQRIFLRARMYPGLKVSRTIGDLISHQIGVISQPKTQIVDFAQNDKLLVVGTAGLWESLTPDALASTLTAATASQQQVPGDGQISQSILDKIKEVNNVESTKDTTFIVSRLR